MPTKAKPIPEPEASQLAEMTAQMRRGEQIGLQRAELIAALRDQGYSWAGIARVCGTWPRAIQTAHARYMARALKDSESCSDRAGYCPLCDKKVGDLVAHDLLHRQEALS